MSPSRVYTSFIDSFSDLTNVVFIILFLWVFILLYDIMVVFHLSFIFDLKSCTKFSTYKCYLWFYIIGHHFSHSFLNDFKICSPFSPWKGMTGNGIFHLERVWQVTGFSQVPLILIHWSWKTRYSWKTSATDALFMEDIFSLSIFLLLLSVPFFVLLCFSYICCKTFFQYLLFP